MKFQIVWLKSNVLISTITHSNELLPISSWITVSILVVPDFAPYVQNVVICFCVICFPFL